MVKTVVLRRSVLCGLAAIAGCAGPSVRGTWVSGDHQDERWPPVPASLQRYAGLDVTDDELSIFEPQGTERPLPEEVVLARRVLDSAPANGRPLEVARYFNELGLGGSGEELSAYAGQWPHRWNPVLVEFFSATRTTPVGDTTPWCAAFVNWCLVRGGARAGSDFAPTNSASSGSFRTWGRAIETGAGESPRVGDIVVFAKVDPTERAVGRGHVGFFLQEDATRVLVLGGNQSEQRPRRQAINRRWFLKAGANLELHSYRTHARLHEAA